MPSDIIFHVQGGLEMLRLCGNGDFLVQGRKVTTDWEVYEGFRRFLAGASGVPLIQLDPHPSDPSNPTAWVRILHDGED